MQLDPSALRVIEAVARAGNLTRAGAALGLSQPAISYQLRRAEDHLGVALFIRGRGGCTPTPAGEVLLRGLLPALAQIDAALAEVRAMARAPNLRILTDFGFAGLWLMPRLGRFRALHPEIEIQITAAQDGRPPRSGEVAIRFARQGDVEGWLWMPERVVPVCAPDHLAAQGPFDSPARLADAALLHVEAPTDRRWLTWAGWFAGQGLNRPARAGELALNTYEFVVQAALAGQGVALGWRPLIDAHLASGALVALGAEVLRPDSGYWVVAPGPETTAHRILFDWLRSELA
ncbi:LysR substrate-binding domain-containing protein [Gemmobacter denitrificans]|uniref:LysR substrate-binding domain-containing protein n=1 Tax=Gemmobacter denitrificans TaxID=3123040 RepID=A0ABU8BZB8_9RHOB